MLIRVQLNSRKWERQVKKKETWCLIIRQLRIEQNESFANVYKQSQGNSWKWNYNEDKRLIEVKLQKEFKLGQYMVRLRKFLREHDKMGLKKKP